MKSNYKKMLAAELYDGADPELGKLKFEAEQRKAVLDNIPSHDIPGRIEAMKALFGTMDGPAILLPPFQVEYGRHIHLGGWVFINFGATFLDGNHITIGANTAVGPNVQFLTTTHPVMPEERIQAKDADQFPPFTFACLALPISIGKRCWIGGGSTIMPGISIGDETVVGAGSVVTKDLPARVVAAGNPARIIRDIPPAP